jgi:hypothetical protein
MIDKLKLHAEGLVFSLGGLRKRLLDSDRSDDEETLS